ncbi:hypothetical protein EIN_409540 [Entamoeba invadens IP1]|uniref:FG-GAP repeat-containing protein n=1 Tax=Entamoeba invadens IP1 TaxID=370355 RepID=A0A0A1TZN5_ENTIV|nr:hypothetical protein EIN_409540 [Entamoeba invadens IP1]ELP85645.1 hypothetical protein EIN_409540 [Entamoeba invadens IP1]|eukprot:XP_004184991.1 hypothetical protein EIN_409540 [Entamoeba invadens IP1]
MNVFKWVVLVACFCLWIFLLKGQSLTQMEQLFSEKYAANLGSTLNVVPIISDIDGDGLNEILVAPYGVGKLIMYKYEKGNLVIKQTATIPSSSQPIYMTTGYDKPFVRNEPRQQTVIVVLRNFDVLCFNSDLTLRWTNNVYKEHALTYVEEVSGLVVPYVIQTKVNGGVILAFRTTQDWYNNNNVGFEEDLRVTLNRTFEEQKEDLMYDDDNIDQETVDHMNYYCLSIKDGQVVWQHEVDDDQDYLDLVKNTDVAGEYKLSKLFGMSYKGAEEIQWHEFHDSIYKNLPHQWASFRDTQITVSHFSRDLTSNPETYDNSRLEMPGMKVQTKTKIDRITNPNVVVIHQKNGLEAVHLFSGKPLVHLSLRATSDAGSSAFADINGDDALEEVFVNQYSHEVDVQNSGEDLTCMVQVIAANSYEYLFSENACKPAMRFDLIRKKDKHVIEVLPPLLVPAFERKSDGSELYNIVVINSDGLLTAVGYNGKFLWNSKVSRLFLAKEDQTHKSNLALFLYSLENEDQKEVQPNNRYIIVQGSKNIAVVNLNGDLMVEHNIESQGEPVMGPVFGDLSNDGNNEILIVTATKIAAYNVRVIQNVSFLPVCIAGIIALISYNIYIIAITYYKKLE